ncbi:MAG: FG-GAP repeat protein, partial [Myxococcales bacterium]|nr:FG-GAP repeat protein [Myxococcales bacterium]
GVGGLVIEPGDQRPHGWSMAGDVNGDGRADLVARSELPQTLMVFGVADSLPIDLDAVAAGAGGLRIELGPAIDPAEGVRSPALGGRPLADLSGDGLGDLAFALPAGDGSEPGSGRVALIFGRSEWGGDVAFNYVAHGERAGDRFGEDVAVADVNGDGDDDLIISAPRADPQGPESGRVYVLFGPLP